ncbi:NAD(P)/FAD-dependent oxidoreductase [Albidovulum sp.]|uniref:NAD(P)/FAD-dependent oxidoreductase n=1 Tax=Albidovulum sp. TaxID=1872424 RepID=UPI0039B925BD
MTDRTHTGRLPETYDLIVVGAGIVGLSTAWRAARAGARVLVLDKGPIAYEASSRATGFLSLCGASPLEVPLAEAAESLWDRLDDDLGYPTEWTRKGRLWVAITPEELDELEASHAAYQRNIGGFERIDGQSCRGMVPALTSAVLGGIYTPRAGHANPQRASQAFAWAFRDLGGEIREYTPVLEILTSGDRIKGVRTPQGDIHADSVVLCAGAHIAPLLAPLGLDFPVAPARLDSMVTAPLPPMFEQALVAHGLAVRQTKRGNLHLNGGAHEWVEASVANEVAKPTTPIVQQIVRRLLDLFPSLGQAQLLRSWAGVIDATPDLVTLVHAFDTPKGLVAASSAGHGFGMSPSLGLALAELALDGRTNLPVASLGLARFAHLPKDWRRVWQWEPGRYNT